MSFVIRVNISKNEVEWMDESAVAFFGSEVAFSSLSSLFPEEFILQVNTLTNKEIEVSLNSKLFSVNLIDVGLKDSVALCFKEKKIESELYDSFHNLVILGYLMDELHDVVLVFNEQGEISFANNTADKTFSKNGDDLIGINISAFTSIDLEKIKKTISESQHAAKVPLEDFKYICDDNNEHVFKGYISKWKYLGEKLFILFAVDITQEEMLINKLEDSKSVFEKIFDKSPVAISISEYETSNFLKVNDIACQLTGYDEAELLGRSPYEIGMVSFEDRESIRGSILSGSYKEYKLIAKDGTELFGLLSGNIINLDGVDYLLSFFTDMTEGVKAKQELEETLELLNTVIETIPGYISVVDKDYNVLEASQGLVKKTGLSSLSEMKGKKCYATFKGRDAVCPECTVEKTFQTGEVVSRLSTLKEFDTYGRTLNIYSAPLKDSSDNIVGAVEVAMDVSELMEAEVKLREQSEYIEGILDFQANIIIVTDGKRMKKCNKSFLEFFQRDSLEHFLADHDCICDFFIERPGYISDSTEKNWLEKLITNFVNGVDSKVVMVNQLTGEERIFFVEHRSFPMAEKEYVVAFTDITDMEMYQLLLQDSNEALDEMVGAKTCELQNAVDDLNQAQRLAGIGSWEYDRKLKRVHLSDEAFRIMGITKVKNYVPLAQVTGTMSFTDMDEFVRLVNKASLTGKKFSLSTSIVTNEGKNRDVEILGVSQKDEDGRNFVSGTIQDLTEKNAMERALFETRKLVDTIFKTASIGLCLINEKCCLEMANRSFCEILGYSEEKVLGKKLSEFADGDALCGSLSSLINSGAEGKINMGNEAVFVTSGGEKRHMFVSADLIHFEKQSFVVLASADITEMKDIQSKQAKQEKMLIQQSKMAAMGEMIGAIAHQWKQPLNSIGLIAQLMQEDFEYGELDKDNLNESIDDIMTQVSFMDSTIDSFRNFFKPAKEMIEFNVFQSIKEVADLLEPQFKNNDVLISFVNKGLDKFNTRANGYPNEFKQVILNIMTNARDAIIEKWEKNGKELYERGTVYCDIYNEGNELVLDFVDEGIGISEAAADSIFDAYYTTKGEKGTGIGLYMSKTIVEDKMFGKIYARKHEKGTCFTIRLPKA